MQNICQNKIVLTYNVGPKSYLTTLFNNQSQLGICLVFLTSRLITVFLVQIEHIHTFYFEEK